jgi:nardilysin
VAIQSSAIKSDYSSKMNQVQVLEAPVKSEGDKKDYRLVKLPNGLKALLIHVNADSSEESESKSDELASLSLAVKVGGYDDPKTAPGLAHFLEHMLSMGSEKYPQENGYEQFIVSNGGWDNAKTRTEVTIYLFTIAEESFPKAVDMFANQFISPLLLKNAMQREREAVDSEIQSRASTDSLIVSHIFKSFMNVEHPASKFIGGNLKTLKEDITDDGLHAELLKLFKKYNANKMYLAMQSKRTLDEMQELVVECFAAIKTGSDEATPPTAIDGIVNPEFYSKVIYIKPKSAEKTLYVTWTFPSKQKHYKKSPIEFIGAMFKNSGKGGLEAYLKDKHLIKDLIFNAVEDNSQIFMPVLKLNMTDEGSKKVDDILEAVFSYLLMMKEASIEDLERLYNDLKMQQEMDFKYHKEKESWKNVYGSSVVMTFYEDADLLRGETLYSEFDGNLITETINRFNERKFNVAILDSVHGNFPKKEKWFGGEYDEAEFSERYQQLWDERKANEKFFLEQPNPFKVEFSN